MNKLITLYIVILIFSISCNKKEDKNSKFLKKYDKIRLISYNTHRDTYRTSYELKIENNTIKIPDVKFIDNIILDKYFAEKITDVLFLEENECVLADCYNPRHLILFYKQNKLIDFYEFCAECGGSRQSKNISFPELCSDKGDKIIAIFKEMKLKNNGEESENYQYF